MSRLVKVLGIIVAGVATLVFVAVGTIYAISGRKLRHTYPLPEISVVVPATEEAVARGQHLVTAVSSCIDCHANDLGGQVAMDAGPLGTIVASNLTRGQGGVGATFDDRDWVLAIRHGLRRDGTSLLLMPSEAYVHFTDDDLGAIIAYLKQLPPVDRQLQPSKLRLLGRALLATGKLPLLAAELMPSNTDRAATEPGATVEYGAYLAGVSGCTTCHGADLAGGPAIGPPGTPAPPNLTPAALGAWSESDFFRALREGKRPDGTAIDEFMPWRSIARMTDDELRAIWLYVRSVPAKESTPTS
jgi:cytochrome c553